MKYVQYKLIFESPVGKTKWLSNVTNEEDVMVNYTEFGYETGKCVQLFWDFGQISVEGLKKTIRRTKKKVKQFTQLILNFDSSSSWLQDELKKAVFSDDIIALYRKYAGNRNYAHLFFENVRIFLLEFFSRILTSDFERNYDGSIRKNCAIKKAQEAVNNNNVNALLNMIDSHARLYSKGEQIAFDTLKNEVSQGRNEDEESAEKKLEKVAKSEIIKGLQKLHAEGMHERELRELCVTYSVDYNDIAAVKTYVQTTLDVA